MPIPRILVRADRVSVSRPGYNVLTVPRTPDYMAVDSSFPAAQRLRLSGVVRNATTNFVRTVYYGQTYPDIPVVELVAMSGNRSVLPMVIEQADQTVPFRVQVLNIRMWQDRFEFSAQLTDSQWATLAFDWFYYVWGT